jgi:hypothetical protein
MDKRDHLMAENNDNNKDSKKGQVTPKNILKKKFDLKFPVFTSEYDMYYFKSELFNPFATCGKWLCS